MERRWARTPPAADGWFPASTFVYSMTTSGSLVFAAGSFQNANGLATADEIAYFDGSAWHPLGSNGAGNGPLNSQVNAVTVFKSAIVAGGNFTNAGGDDLADSLGTFAMRRPDARIGTLAAGPFTGNNVYSATGAGESKTVSVVRGKKGTLYADIQNDGLVADALKVKGTGAATGFTVSYFRGTTNVTAAVKAGTFSTGSLAPRREADPQGGRQGRRFERCVGDVPDQGDVPARHLRRCRQGDRQGEVVRPALQGIEYRSRLRTSG